MYQPKTYATALLFMLTSMTCWGSWANTMKLCPGYRFQLFYWDYLGGLLVGAVLCGITLGSMGASGTPFLVAVTQANVYHVGMAVAGGAVFNVANLLLVAAIEVAGLAVAFPVGIGLALIIGAVSNYFIHPEGNPWLLFGGIALVLAAIVLDSGAYHLREKTPVGGGRKGILLSLVSGFLMGGFYPLVSKAIFTPGAPGPYAVALFFVFGVILCALPTNYLLMRRPLDSLRAVSLSQFGAVPGRFHLIGLLGGIIWCVGAVTNFVASRTHFVGPAVSYSIGQGATMVSAAWGVFVWREFRGSSRRVHVLLAFMFVLFLFGLSAIAIAPLWLSH